MQDPVPSLKVETKKMQQLPEPPFAQLICTVWLSWRVAPAPAQSELVRREGGRMAVNVGGVWAGAPR